jgi:hypothetical protein
MIHGKIKPCRYHDYQLQMVGSLDTFALLVIDNTIVDGEQGVYQTRLRVPPQRRQHLLD